MKSSINFFQTWFLLTPLILFACGKPQGDCKAVPANSIRQSDPAEVLKMVQEASSDFSLINIYASWCKPCKVEMPEIIKMRKDEKTPTNVILVSIDEEKEVKNVLPSFLGCTGVDFETFFFSTDQEKFVKTLFPEWQGMIPLSLIYSKNGERVGEIEGITSIEEISMIINRYKKTHSYE